MLGDNKNDIDMFREAGLCAAVFNAVPVLKEEADYISCSQWVYGVIEALETLVIPQLYSEHPAQRQTNRKR